VSVLSEPEIRIERIICRDGITREAAEERVRAQKNDSFYAEYSDTVLINDGDKEGFFGSCRNLLSEL